MRTIRNLLITLIFYSFVFNAFSQSGYRPGWPHQIEGHWRYCIINSLAVYSFESGESIIAAANNGQIALFDCDGNLLPGWPVTHTGPPAYTDGIIAGGPIIGDINGDGSPEICVLAVMEYGVQQTRVYNFDGELNHIMSQTDTMASRDNTVQAHPVLFDINNDGKDELLRITDDSLFATNEYGEIIEGFPWSTGEQYGSLYSGLVIGSGDGWDWDQNIILWSTRNLVHARVIGSDHELPGWPVHKDGYAQNSHLSLIPMGNGWLVTTISQDSIYVWDQDGNSHYNFPILNPDHQEVGRSHGWEIMVADIDGDNIPEIFNNPSLPHLNGFSLIENTLEGFPLEITQAGDACVPSFMVNSQSDSSLIFIGSRINDNYRTLLKCYRYTNALQEFYFNIPLTVRGGFPDQVALIPPYNDTLMVVFFEPAEGLFVFNYPMDRNGTHMEWPMPGNTPGGNRLYNPRHFLGIEDNDPTSSLPTELKINSIYPNPGNSSFNFNVSFNGDGVYSIYDILGREVYSKAINGNNMRNGILHWNGKNHLDDRVSSGIYFFQLKNGHESVTQKFVYLQ